MGTVFSFVLALFKAVPIIEEWYQRFSKVYVEQKISDVESRTITKEDQRIVLTKKIDEAKNANEAAILFSALNDLERVPVHVG